MGRDPVLADITAIIVAIDLIETELHDLRELLHALRTSLRNGNVTEDEP